MEKETLEEATERIINNKDLSWENDYAKESFIKGANWQAERMYSEEQLRKSFHVGRLYQGRESDTTFEEWFEQFKKK